MTQQTPRQPGRETSGHTGAGLIGDLDTGIDAGREAREATDRAHEREARRTDAQEDAHAREPDGIEGLPATERANVKSPRDAFPDALATGTDSPSLAGEHGGERASAGTNDANRSSHDHSNTLDD